MMLSSGHRKNKYYHSRNTFRARITLTTNSISHSACSPIHKRIPRVGRSLLTIFTTRIHLFTRLLKGNSSSSTPAFLSDRCLNKIMSWLKRRASFVNHCIDIYHVTTCITAIRKKNTISSSFDEGAWFCDPHEGFGKYSDSSHT